MINPEAGNFMNPVFQPILDKLPEKAADPYENFAEIRRIIKDGADQYVTSPLVIAKEMQLSRVDNALEAHDVEKARISRFGYVGDIHGLTDADFAKLRETLVAGEFDQVFFLGDIGGSEKLIKLQRFFYQGGPELSDNQFYNKYNAMIKEGATQDEAIEAVKGGYLNLRAYEIHLESIARISESEAKEIAQQEMIETPTDITKQKILATLSHKHYGHYVSDLPVEAIISLQADVEHYYERFLTMTREIKARGVDVFVLQGNWDARLPFDFEPGTENPVPLPQNKRRFNPSKFFRRKVPYFTELGTVDSRDALHIMVPFDAVNGDAVAINGKDRLRTVRSRIIEAKQAGKRVEVLTHAVPAWERHTDKQPTGEGKTTQAGLQELLAILRPHEAAYGHEHKARPNPSTIYKLRKTVLGMEAGIEEDLTGIEESEPGILAIHIPIPGEIQNGIATLELSKYGNKAPRGNGGKQSPMRVGRPEVAHVIIDKAIIPSNETLFPQGRRPR